MGIETDVYRRVRYTGAGCAHDLLMRATRPSAPNADQGALDAADAFAEGSLQHLQRWFETSRLPSLCPASHSAGPPRDDESGDAHIDDPGFRWVDDDGHQAYFLIDSGRDGDLYDAEDAR